MLTDECPSWTSSASELVMKLELDIQPNALTNKLNVKAASLLNDYSIRYENNHTRTGSKINLKHITDEQTA